jgi:hypothetical protein
MLKMKELMLSTTHAIFCGLQDHVASLLHNLLDSAPSQLRDGLVEAHTKLSDYYFHLDESPYYTWATCEYKFLILSCSCKFGCILDWPGPTTQSCALSQFQSNPSTSAYHIYFQCSTPILCLRGLSQTVHLTPHC